MEWQMVVSIVVALIGAIATIFAAIKSSKVTLERTNIQNAKEIYDEYRQLQIDTKVELKSERERNEEYRKSTSIKMGDLENLVRDLQYQMRTKEEFYQKEIDILKEENKQLRNENIELKALVSSEGNT